MSVYDGISCSSYLLKPYVQQAVSGPGIYTIKWTPTQTGSFIAYGRVWNDGIAECKADCVDGPPRYLCANAPLCKLTGTVKTAPVMSCVSLTGDTSIEVGDIATFTCEANFSSVSPVAYFRYKYITGGGIYTTSEPIALSGTTASYDIIIDQAGNWIVQCQVCTDDTASKSCTVWGQAN
ncbi:hypothetical protein KKB06_03350, partial [Patescibacteria group bacterium]|nr:hypothetical protein [Patescibacteria group bacterium]